MNRMRYTDAIDLSGIYKWGLAGLIIAVAMAGVVSTVSAEGGNIRYSYEAAKIGGGNYALMPRAEDRLAGEVTNSTLEQAFESLRRSKRSTYGNSYADVSGTLGRNIRVEVHIDSNYAQYAPVIMAEAVYTLTEYGVPEVYFPGHTEKGLTRSDVSVPAYTLTVPLWMILPSSQVTMAQVLMPDGELISVDEVERRWSQEQEVMIDAVYSYLDSEDPFTVRGVVRMVSELGELRIDDITPLLVHDARHVRRATLNVLEGFEDDERVLRAITDALPDESNSSQARRMAEYLGKSSNDHFNVEEPFYLVREGDDDEAVQAIKDLAQWDDDPRVVAMLAAALSDERAGVASAAVESLDTLQAHSERAAALNDEEIDAEIRASIADDLAAETNEPEQRLIGLTYIANTRSGGYANQAIAAIGELPIDTARVQVEEFLSDESRERRLAAIRTLTERNEVESVQALMEASGSQRSDPEMREAAYEVMVSQSLDVVMEQVDANSVAVQQIAYEAIGERSSRDGQRQEAVEAIELGIDHRQSSIRAAAARSLGEIGGDDALEMLGAMTDDNDPAVRRAVALALGEFSGPDHGDTLAAYLDDSDPGVVAAAIDAMEQRGDEGSIDRIQDMIRHDEPEIRASALRAITSFLPDRDDEDQVRRHMGLLSGFVGDESSIVKQSALEQLGRFESSMAVTNIASLVGNEDTEIRTAAIQALASTGHNDAMPLLRTALRDSEAEVRREAVRALTELAGSDARPELEGRMEEEEDPEVRELIQSQLQQI